MGYTLRKVEDKSKKRDDWGDFIIAYTPKEVTGNDDDMKTTQKKCSKIIF